MAIIKKFRIKSFKEYETLLELEKVSMFYNKRQILNNLNLKISRQEILGMLGPNGVGMSTIIHIITISSIRYRFPIEPILIIFASFVIKQILSKKKII